jgi:hypothetical protein
MICDEIDQPGEKVVAQTEVGELLIMMKTCMDLAAEKKSKGTKSHCHQATTTSSRGRRCHVYF